LERETDLMSNAFPKRVGLCLLILAWTVPAQAKENILKQITQVRPAVVTVIIYSKTKRPLGNGRGFFIDKKGHLITNYHVLSSPVLMGASSAYIRTSQGHEYQIKMVVAENREADLIKVLVDIPGNNIHFVKISNDGPKVAERVFVLGKSRSNVQNMNWGNISAITEMPPKGTVCQTTIIISPGLSGSPVFNTKAEVIGVACGHRIDEQNLSFAISSDQLLDLEPGKTAQTLSEWFQRFAEQPTAAQDTLNNAYVMLRVGNYSKALDNLKEIVNRNPRLSKAWYFSGYCHFKLHRYDQAIESYKRALKIEPDCTDALFGLGLVYTEMGQYSQAITAFRQLIEITPESAEAYYFLGVIYDKSDNRHQAINVMNQAVKIKPDYSKAYFSLGLIYSKLGRYDKATEAFSEVIRIKPNYAEAHCNLGIAYAELRHYPEAIDSFRQAIKIRPDYAETYFNLGLAHGKLDRYAEAIEVFKQGLRSKPDDPRGYFNLGLMYRKSNRDDEAIEALEQAVKIEPGYAEAHFELGLTYLKVGKETAALAEYLLLEELDKNKATKLFNLIMK